MYMHVNTSKYMYIRHFSMYIPGVASTTCTAVKSFFHRCGEFMSHIHRCDMTPGILLVVMPLESMAAFFSPLILFVFPSHSSA